MGRAVRKNDVAVPRRRLIKEAPIKINAERDPWCEAVSVLFFVVAVFLLCSLSSYIILQNRFHSIQPHQILSQNIMGPVGARIAKLLFSLLGWCSFVTVVWSFMLGRNIWRGPWPKRQESLISLITSIIASFIMAIASAAIATVFWGEVGGGKVGAAIAYKLVRYVNEAGTLLIMGATVLLTFSSSTRIGTQHIVRFFRSLSSDTIAIINRGCGVMIGTSYRGASMLTAPVRGISKNLKELKVNQKNIANENELFFSDEDIVKDKRIMTNDIDCHEIKETPQLNSEDEILDVELDDRENEDDDFSGSEIVISRQHGKHAESSEKKPTLKSKRISLLRKKQKHNPELQSTVAETEDEPLFIPQTDNYSPPPSELLVAGEISTSKAPRDSDLLANSRRLEQSLLNFKIGGKVVEVHPGPVITLYQFEPAPGVKVQRIISLADDLALTLKVASVRVYAPVPGKGTVGIEVPNTEREIVRLRDLLEHKDFKDPQLSLPLALGKDTFGDPYIADLSKMPHLLIAGATGTGKSVCINSLLLSLLYRNSPSQLRLIMIDPKMLELSVYEDIPHLKAPVVTFAKRARGVLWWAVEEMERRYSLMKEIGVRNLASYNSMVTSGVDRHIRANSSKLADNIIELHEKDIVSTPNNSDTNSKIVKEKISIPLKKTSSQQLNTLPRIVIVVDELADLMLTVGREIEELLTRLAQKARAAGIHLILATQRPSVNVITGLIKANFPSRISFKVASRIDARTVLDNSGAEKLLGQGDMLFLSPGAGRAKRLHGPFVSDAEVHQIVDWLRQQGAPNYDEEIEQMIERFDAADEQQGEHGESVGEYDPLYDQAVNLVLEKGQASTSMVQRVFRIGYNRAARILETMEREGVVGPADGAKPRVVLVPGRNMPI